MANMKEVLPKGDYKVKTVGPPRNWEYNGTAMVTDSVQFEGFEQYWIDVNRKADSPVPSVGEILKGNVEQDEAGKYAPKFKKENSGWQGGRSGGQASPGAIWSTAMQTAATIVSGFYLASGTKPADLKEFFSKVEFIAPKVNAAVDRLVAKAPKVETKPADTTSSEAGESQAPVQQSNAVVVQDIADDELGEW